MFEHQKYILFKGNPKNTISMRYNNKQFVRKRFKINDIEIVKFREISLILT